MIPISYFVVLSFILFFLGIVAFFVKKDLLTQFMAVEIMLNAANLAFIAFAKASNALDGQVIVFFIITVAGAEAAIGLAIILLIFRHRKTIKTEDINLMKG